MKPFFTIIALSMMGFHLAAAADEMKSVVRFANHDQLSGSLESLTTERLVWNSPILEKPTPFFLKSVLDLTLSATQPQIDAKHEATVSLTNGDSVRGQLVSITDDSVELDTWFAGRMKFRRVMISDIRIDERPDYFYQGPSGLDGWTQTETPAAWSYADSSFRSNASGGIARDVGLPDECSISFEAGWRGQFGLKLVFFSDDTNTDNPPNGYSLGLQSRSIVLNKLPNQISLGRAASSPALQENEKASIEVRASLKTGKICVFVDRTIVAVWTDPDFAKNKMGRGIHFVTLNNSPVKVSGIKVAAWDGVIEQMPAPQIMGGFRQFGLQEMEEEQRPAPEEKPKAGRMKLRNGDSLEGDVLAISGEMVTIKTPFKDVRIPVGMLRSVALKPAPREEPKRENGDVRGWFPDGTSLVFRLEGVGDGTLSGTNQNFGAAQFKTSAFSRIEFNIYNWKFDDLRNAGDW